MEDAPRVVFAGGIYRDLVTITPKFPKPGETLKGTEFFMGFGGKSSNQAVMCGKLGAKVAMIGKLGDDTNGQAYLDHYKTLGIDTRHVGVVKGVASGVATILVDEGSGENLIVIVAGSNDHMTPDDIVKAESIISKAKIAVSAMEMDFKTIATFLSKAKENNLKTILNAAPIPDKNAIDIEVKKKIFANVDILCVNESEAELLSDGLKVDTIPEVKAAIPKLMASDLLRHVQVLIVTVGARGAVFATRDNDDVIHVDLENKVDVVDTTGAGDAFVGSLAYFLDAKSDLDLSEVIRRSCLLATMSVQKKGTQSSYPERKDIPQNLLS